MKKWTINFWIWWYFILLPNEYKRFLRFWMYSIGYLNVVPMLRNLFTPLYQDYTFTGRVVGLLIRSVWVLFGFLIMIPITIIVLIGIISMILIPLIPIFMILSIIFNI